MPHVQAKKKLRPHSAAWFLPKTFYNSGQGLHLHCLQQYLELQLQAFSCSPDSAAGHRRNIAPEQFMQGISKEQILLCNSTSKFLSVLTFLYLEDTRDFLQCSKLRSIIPILVFCMLCLIMLALKVIWTKPVIIILIPLQLCPDEVLYLLKYNSLAGYTFLMSLNYMILCCVCCMMGTAIRRRLVKCLQNYFSWDLWNRNLKSLRLANKVTVRLPLLLRTAKRWMLMFLECWFLFFFFSFSVCVSSCVFKCNTFTKTLPWVIKIRIYLFFLF